MNVSDTSVMRGALNKRYKRARQALKLMDETEDFLDFMIATFPPTKEEVHEIEEMRHHTKMAMQAYLAHIYERKKKEDQLAVRRAQTERDAI